MIGSRTSPAEHDRHDNDDHHDHAIVAELCRRAAVSNDDVNAVVDAGIRELAPLQNADERQRLVRRVLANLTGLGALDDLLADPDIDEVLVNAKRDVWVERAGTISRHPARLEHSVEHLLERMLAPIGRRVDRTSPIVDARLADGSRVCAVLPPVAVDGAVLSIRKFATSTRQLDEFTDEFGVDLINRIVDARCNVIASGATSAGKSSFLAALLRSVGPSQRIVVVEDTREIIIESDNAVRLEARPSMADGPAPVTLADLVRTALRLRPDRIVVGEVRGDEVLALVQAMNTGHDGSMSTCHANSAPDALLRLESLVLQAAPSWPLAAIRHQLHRSIDVIVHLVRDTTGTRRIDCVVELCNPRQFDSNHGEPPTLTLARADSRGALKHLADPTRHRRGAPTA